MITIHVTPNQSKRTFTIRKKENGKTITKHRTNKMTKPEFLEAEFYTSFDWFDYLENSQDYYKV